MSCCDGRHDHGMPSLVGRREFLQRAGQSAIVVGAAASMAPWARAAEATAAAGAAADSPESLVKLLYESFTPGQREKVCFHWDHKHAEYGLLRTRVDANWLITEQTLNSSFYTDEQRELVQSDLPRHCRAGVARALPQGTAGRLRRLRQA